MITPEAKKRMEEFIDKEFPTQWDDGSCRYSEFQRDLVRDGYQAADQANKELLLECERMLSTYQNMGGVSRRIKLSDLLEKLRAMGNI